MSLRAAPVQSRMNNNSGIKFALAQSGGGLNAPGSSSSNTYSEKSACSGNVTTREKAPEDLSRHGHWSQHATIQARSARTPVRTVPGTIMAVFTEFAILTDDSAWVRSAEEDDLVTEPPSDYFLPNSPQSAFVAQHNHSPWAKLKNSGQYSETLQDRNALLSGRPHPVRKSRWISFASPGTYPREHWQGEKVRPEWLNQHFTDYSKPWLADHNDDDVEDGSGRYHAFRRKRKTWHKRAQQTILRNPMIPLIFRMTVFTFSVVAVGLGASIHQDSEDYNFSQGPSALMAIIVDAVALVYILYITYDEYTGKPLGLRPAKAKLRIILLDIFFIVFQSANLSLAFQTLSDPGEACTPGTSGLGSDATNAGICRKQKALASVLLIALIAWLNTFCVSVLR
jgi:hypothetical protein